VSDAPIDIGIVGGGAAGLATAIFARRYAPHKRVVVFDAARSPGAKILVSGGGRCNVTNVDVGPGDFNGGRPTIIGRVLRALPVGPTVAFFRELGVSLHEEANGKLFPDSNRSRDVLDALLHGLRTAGAELRSSQRVVGIARSAGGTFELATANGPVHCARVVLATGGLSLPKTGSDGGGYGLARQLGHSIVPTTPALVPLAFTQDENWHERLSGVSMPVHVRVEAPGAAATKIEGDLLWTHFGISGPAALDASRHWLRHELEGRVPRLGANLLRLTFEAAEAAWLARASRHHRQQVLTTLGTFVPAAVAEVLCRRAGVSSTTPMAELTRQARRQLLHLLVDCPLPIAGSRGYNYAEVTAGGVDLREIDPATMQSRCTPGLFLAGEVLDVDGRLGGFNFQWAWSSAFTCGCALSHL
jgi:predicted Rossmann fold flavoprotein